MMFIHTCGIIQRTGSLQISSACISKTKFTLPSLNRNSGLIWLENGPVIIGIGSFLSLLSVTTIRVTTEQSRIN